MNSLGAGEVMAAGADLTSNGTAWLLAITAAITGIGALVMNRRGAKEQNALQKAANSMVEDKQRLEETEQAITSLERALTRAEADADRYRRLYTEAEAESTEQRELHRKMYSAQEARCREYASDLTDVILMLRHVVLDEVANAAATMAMARQEHPHEDRRRTALPGSVTPRGEGQDGDVADLDGG